MDLKLIFCVYILLHRCWYKCHTELEWAPLHLKLCKWRRKRRSILIKAIFDFRVTFSEMPTQRIPMIFHKMLCKWSQIVCRFNRIINDSRAVFISIYTCLSFWMFFVITKRAHAFLTSLFALYVLFCTDAFFTVDPINGADYNLRFWYSTFCLYGLN